METCNSLVLYLPTIYFDYLVEIFFWVSIIEIRSWNLIDQQLTHTVQKSRNSSPVFLICGANNAVEHYGKRIKILHGCPFEGWPNRARQSHPFWQKGLGWPCPVRSALKRTPKFKKKYFSFRIEKLHKMAYIIFYFFWKSLKKLKK